MRVKFSDRIFSDRAKQRKLEKQKEINQKYNIGTFECTPLNNPFLTFTFPNQTRRDAARKAAEILAGNGLEYRLTQRS